jgi:hypothetical protein
MKNLLGILACIIISKLLSTVAVSDNLAVMLVVNYFALTIGYFGSLCFLVLFMYEAI